MEKRIVSEHVMVGKIIRNHLKHKLGLSGAVRVDGKGGTSVDVFLTDLSPRLKQQITLFCNQFKAGSFNSANDVYEFNHAKNGPTVQYVSIHNEFSEEKYQSAFDALRTKVYPEEMANLKPEYRSNNPFFVVDGQPLRYVVRRALDGVFEDEAEAVWGADDVAENIEIYTIGEDSEIQVLEAEKEEFKINPIALCGFHEASQITC